MEGKWPEDPTDFEAVGRPHGSGGVAKTPFGWFPLDRFELSADTLTLAFSTLHQVPPTIADVQIIERALALLQDESKWNRADNRTCPTGSNTVSVFCALLQATHEVVGSAHYRQPALQAVRSVLDEVGDGRIQRHRLMEYNNHPNTSLHDIHVLLRTAAQRMLAELKRRSGG